MELCKLTGKFGSLFISMSLLELTTPRVTWSNRLIPHLSKPVQWFTLWRTSIFLYQPLLWYRQDIVAFDGTHTGKSTNPIHWWVRMSDRDNYDVWKAERQPCSTHCWIADYRPPPFRATFPWLARVSTRF